MLDRRDLFKAVTATISGIFFSTKKEVRLAILEPVEFMKTRNLTKIYCTKEMIEDRQLLFSLFEDKTKLDETKWLVDHIDEKASLEIQQILKDDLVMQLADLKLCSIAETDE